MGLTRNLRQSKRTQHWRTALQNTCIGSATREKWKIMDVCVCSCSRKGDGVCMPHWWIDKMDLTTTKRDSSREELSPSKRELVRVSLDETRHCLLQTEGHVFGAISVRVGKSVQMYHRMRDSAQPKHDYNYRNVNDEWSLFYLRFLGPLCVHLQRKNGGGMQGNGNKKRCCRGFSSPLTSIVCQLL